MTISCMYGMCNDWVRVIAISTSLNVYITSLCWETSNSSLSVIPQIYNFLCSVTTQSPKQSVTNTEEETTEIISSCLGNIKIPLSTSSFSLFLVFHFHLPRPFLIHSFWGLMEIWNAQIWERITVLVLAGLQLQSRITVTAAGEWLLRLPLEWHFSLLVNMAFL